MSISSQSTYLTPWPSDDTSTTPKTNQIHFLRWHFEICKKNKKATPSLRIIGTIFHPSWSSNSIDHRKKPKGRNFQFHQEAVEILFFKQFFYLLFDLNKVCCYFEADIFEKSDLLEHQRFIIPSTGVNWPIFFKFQVESLNYSVWIKKYMVGDFVEKVGVKV